MIEIHTAQPFFCLFCDAMTDEKISPRPGGTERNMLFTSFANQSQVRENQPSNSKRVIFPNKDVVPDSERKMLTIQEEGEILFWLSKVWSTYWT